MKLVRQQHESSCVPACIATLTEIPYLKAMRLVHPWKKTKAWDNFGTTIEAMTFGLKRAGLKVKQRDPVPFSRLRCNAIIDLEHPAYGPPEYRNHVVVWDYKQQRVLDPYVGRGIKRHLPRTSYEKSALIIFEVR